MAQGRRTLIVILTPTLILVAASVIIRMNDEFGSRGSEEVPAVAAAHGDASRHGPDDPTADSGRDDLHTAANAGNAVDRPRSMPTPPRGRVVGSIRRRDGTPVARAEVVARCFGNLLLGTDDAGRLPFPEADGIVVADERGRFALDALPGGFYELVVSAPGLARRRLPRALPDREEEITLDEPATIVGIIEEKGTGRRVLGAEIHVTDEAGDQQAVSDAGGAFTVLDVVPHGITITAIHGDYAPVVTRLDVVPGQETDIRIALSAGCQLHARAVSKDDDRPVPGASFAVTDRLSGLVLANLAAASDGTIRFGGLAADRDYVISATKKGWSTGWQVVRARDNETAVAVVELTSSWTLNGLVRTESGAAVAEAYLVVEGIGVVNAAGGNERRVVFTNGDGCFAVTGLSPSLSYTLTAYHPTAAIRVVSGLTRETCADRVVPVELARPGHVQGVVVDSAGRAVAGALVILETPSLGLAMGGRLYTWTDACGGYAFNNVPAGTSNVIVIQPLLGSASANNVTVSPDDPPCQVELQFDAALPNETPESPENH